MIVFTTDEWSLTVHVQPDGRSVFRAPSQFVLVLRYADGSVSRHNTTAINGGWQTQPLTWTDVVGYGLEEPMLEHCAYCGSPWHHQIEGEPIACPTAAVRNAWPWGAPSGAVTLRTTRAQ